LAVVIFYTLGGIGGFTVLRARAWTWETAINHDCSQFTTDNQELYWFHGFSHILLPQRSATYSFPLLVFVTVCIYEGVNATGLSKSQKSSLFLMAGFITGLLPLVHAHSLACLAIVFLPYALLHPVRSFSLNETTGLFIHWLQFGIPILGESLLQLPVYMDRLGPDATQQSSSFLRYSPLWRGQWATYRGGGLLNEICNFCLLWARGTGLFMFLGLIGFLFFNGRQRKLYFCFWLIFVVSNLVQFQPWDKDNTKMFIVWAMICTAGVSLVIYKLWRIPLILTKIFAVLVVISLILSGSMMLYRESTLWWQYMDHEDHEFGNWIAVNTDPDAVFIVNDSHIHPVTNLGGRTAVVNMAGWVQSHGYPDMWKRYSDLREMLARPAFSKELYTKYNISYVVYDWRLQHDNQVDMDFFQFDPNIKLVFHTPKYSVFDTSTYRS
jgi:hypothetical protein